MKDNEKGNNLNRRQFLKAAGAGSAVLGSAGLGFFGYQSGRDPETYTGWETYEGAQQTFNRKRWSVNEPTYKKVGPTTRADARTEVIFSRRPRFSSQWKDETGLDGLDPVLQDYYRRHPEDLELDLYAIKEIAPKQRVDMQ